jgi:hypothetical protein
LDAQNRDSPTIPGRTAAIFLLSAAGILLQVSLTRILSLVAWHHFAYLIISLALLGIGAAGTYLTFALRTQTRASISPWIARFSFFFAVSVLVCLLLVVHIRFDPIKIYLSAQFSELWGLVLIEIAVAIPFFFAGTAVGAILSTSGSDIGGVYFADLAGAAGGGLLSLLLVETLGAQSSIFMAAALAAGAACVLTWRAGIGVPRRYTVTVALGVALALLGGVVDPVPIRFASSKMAAGHEHEIEATRWNSIARVDIFEERYGLHGFAGGYGAEAKRYPYGFRPVTQDGAAPTAIVRVEKDPKEMNAFGYYLQSLPYKGRAAPRSLVIGVGGAPDIVIALHHGARKVVGVEVNRAMVGMLTEEFGDWAGNIRDRPDVEIHNAEGRHFVTRDPRKFDIIQLSGVDTFSALASGAYALAENFLYTVEASHDFLDHLKPDGIVSYSRWFFDPPRESIRLVSTHLRALEERGIDDAHDRFVIVHGRPASKPAFPWAETLLKNSAFTTAEVDVYKAFAAQNGFTVVYDPFEERDNIFDRMIRGDPETRRAITAAYIYDISPATDDNPFFFQFYRLRNVFGGDFLDPALVSGTDKRARRTGRLGEVPLGLIVLLVSILLIAVLSAIFIARPLSRSSGSLRGLPGTPAVVGYFALVGLGFMFVEIVLLQKLTVFLGGPTYSMGVTLASLLFFAGVGAGLSRFLGEPRKAPLIAVLGVLLVALGGELLFLREGVPALLGLSHLARCIVAVAAIAPIGILLGFPFPVGLRLVGAVDPRLVPWAFGINGCASVLGGMLCVLFSMQVGLSAAWAAGILLYVSAGVVLLALPVPAEATTDTVEAQTTDEPLPVSASSS